MSKPEGEVPETSRKRAASVSTVEPPEAKTKATVKTMFVGPKEEASAKPPRPESDKRIANIGAHLSTPYPIVDDIFLVVDTAKMETFFKYVWTAIVNCIYPDSRFTTSGLISQANFVLVCRYLFKARIDQVYSSVSGRRPVQRIALSKDYLVPRCLSDLANGIGTFSAQGGALNFIPTPENDPNDQTQRLTSLVSQDIQNAFSRLVKAAERRGFITLHPIGNISAGTAWWLLSVRNSSDHSIIATDSNNVWISSTFKEWTPADAIMAAVVQRQYDGLVENVEVASKWTTDSITGIASVRETFIIDC